MAKSRHMILQPLLAENIDPQLYRFILSLQPGHQPSFSEALSIAEATDGLAHRKQECESAIFHGILWAVLSTESKRQLSSQRRRAREINCKRLVQLSQLKLLYKELEGDAASLGDSHSHEKSGDILGDYQAISGVIADLARAIDSLEDWLGKRSSDLRDSGGNRLIFETAYVKAIREIWQHITGSDAGIARVPVVKFASAIWIAFDFGEPEKRSLYDWLSERFDNVR